MRRMSIVLLAFLIITVVPRLEYLEWKNENSGLLPETGRVTDIERTRCRGASAAHPKTCSYATIEYSLSAGTIGVLKPTLSIPSQYRIGDQIPLLIDPKNREHVLLLDRADKVFAFVGVPSIFAGAAFVFLLGLSRFIPAKEHHGRGG